MLHYFTRALYMGLAFAPVGLFWFAILTLELRASTAFGLAAIAMIVSVTLFWGGADWIAETPKKTGRRVARGLRY